jgi:hypothetical protein
MATKTQSKAAIDAAVTAIKNDIDNILPTIVDIVNGSIRFAPFRYLMQLNSADLTTATSLATAIGANLTAASRTFTITFSRRKADGTKGVVVRTGGHSIQIVFP